MTDLRAWNTVTHNHSFVLDNLDVTKPFVDILCRKKVLRAEEKNWLLPRYNTAADDDDRRRLKIIFLYTMLFSYPDACSSYLVFQNALLTTKQNDLLHRLIEYVGDENTPPAVRDQTELFSRSPLGGSSSAFIAQATDDMYMYMVDIVADKEILRDVEEYFLSIRTRLSRELNSVDPQQIEIRLHRVHAPETLVVIYPVLDVQDESSQWPGRGTERSVGFRDFLSLEERDVPENLQVQLIPVCGLGHLFSKRCEDSLRDGYLADDSGSHCTRDTNTRFVFKAEDLEYDSNDDLIGSGAFSEVFKVSIPTLDRTAALKIVSTAELRETDMDLFKKELFVLQEVGHHENIVELLGICHMRTKEALVLEYAENGDLDELLTHHLGEHPSVLEWPCRENMAFDVARGTKFLHREVYIVHLDLKTSNVLVGKDYCCKISDFGSCEFSDFKNSHFSKSSKTSREGIIFTAPERFRGNEHWKTKKRKADVYAYAMVLYHLKELKKPWQDETNADLIKANVLAKERPPLVHDDGCPDYLEILIKQCWAQKPEQRPHFDSIVDQFEILRQDTSAATDTGYKTAARSNGHSIIRYFQGREGIAHGSLPAGFAARGIHERAPGRSTRHTAGFSTDQNLQLANVGDRSPDPRLQYQDSEVARREPQVEYSANVTRTARILRNAAKNGTLSDFKDKFSDIPVDVFQAVCNIAGSDPSALGDYLGVGDDDVSGKTKTDVPNETVRHILEVWMQYYARDATLESLCHALEKVKLLGRLEQKLGHEHPKLQLWT